MLVFISFDWIWCSFTTTNDQILKPSIYGNTLNLDKNKAHTHANHTNVEMFRLKVCKTSKSIIILWSNNLCRFCIYCMEKRRKPILKTNNCTFDFVSKMEWYGVRTQNAFKILSNRKFHLVCIEAWCWLIAAFFRILFVSYN